MVRRLRKRKKTKEDKKASGITTTNDNTNNHDQSIMLRSPLCSNTPTTGAYIYGNTSLRDWIAYLSYTNKTKNMHRLGCVLQLAPTAKPNTELLQ